MDWSVKDYGAVADGKQNDTTAFQEAIKACHLAGGGRVVVEKGCYRLGLLRFYSHVELHLCAGARLIASNDLSDFDGDQNVDLALVTTPTWDACDYDGKPTKYFIYAYQCEDIAITGEGIIDGNEELFYGKVTKWHIDGYFYPRVPLLYFEDCHNIRLLNATLTRSAFWTVHLVGCRDILIDSISIKNNLRLANCDGIDPDHCKNVQIRNCQIEAADDCIVFKTTAHAKKYGACENILVANCTLISTSAAIKFGTESVSDFKNIHIQNCTILNSNRGICLQLRDEGSISDITFENINIETRRFSPVYWWGKAEPIILTAVRRNPQTQVGCIQHITFRNITMDTENGIFIYGTAQNITDIHFDTLKLKLRKKTSWEHNTYDLRPSEQGILELSNRPLFLHSCKQVYFSNFQYELMSPFLAEEYYLEDIDSVYINAVSLLDHLEELHSTERGYQRIEKNTGIQQVEAYLKQAILAEKASIIRHGKNFYVEVENFIFTIHATSYTIITAHSRKKVC